MVGTTIGGGCGDDAPPPPQQFLSSSSSSSVRPSFPCDSEEFSAFFNQFLSPEMDHNNNIMITATNRVLHPSSSSSVSSSVFNFSSHHNNDPIDHNNNNNSNTNDDDDTYIPAPLLPPNSNASNTNKNQQQHSITCSIQKNGEDSELPSKPVPPPRTSSKRSRAAEFHNLSEKRRRSRINEKMKALQNLIPNSNKTDKASMLDEAIEYLKQLQLQVQMLMIRNGLSLHPMSLPMVLPNSGLNFDEGNGFQNSMNAIASSANHDEPSFCFPKQCSISNQSAALPSMTYTSSSFQSSVKDAQCNNMPHQLLDTRRIGKTPSPDVS